MTVIGFTRPLSRLDDAVKEARDMGFDVMAAPSLEILPGDDAEFEKFQSSLADGITVVFGSGTAAEECNKRFGESFPTMLQSCNVISIGPNTTKVLTSFGVRVDSVPSDFSSYGLVDMLKGDVSGKKVVVVRSDSGSDVLSDGLKDAGAEVIDVASYKLKKAGMGNGLLHMFYSIKRKRMDCMAFTSPMSAQSFFDDIREFFGAEVADRYMRDNVKVAAIGRPTAMKLESLGRKPDIVPERTTFHDMLEAIKGAFE